MNSSWRSTAPIHPADRVCLVELHAGPSLRAGREISVDDTVNRLAKELAEAMADAVASDPRVEACRARAREAGYDLRVTLDAEIGFATRTGKKARKVALTRPSHATRHVAMTDNDRRFLKSLRIAPDAATEEV
jgi:hypothetical protein